MKLLLNALISLVATLILLAPHVSEAQSNRHVYGQHVQAAGPNALEVTYHLNSFHTLYEVELLVSTDGGETFHPLAQEVTGDVGRSVQPGEYRRIVWEYANDFPVDFGTGAYELKVQANRQNRSGDSWLTYAGIGVGMVAAGVTAGLLLSNGSGTNSGGLNIPLGSGR